MKISISNGIVSYDECELQANNEKKKKNKCN